MKIKSNINFTQNVFKIEKIFQVTSTVEEHACLWWNVFWGRVDTADSAEEGVGKLILGTSFYIIV